MRILRAKDKNIIFKIRQALESGQVLVLPTDTVYGLVADATNNQAVKKIFIIKDRPTDKPIGIFVKDMAMAKRFAEINLQQEEILKKYWPGPTTFIFRIKPLAETGLNPVSASRSPGTRPGLVPGQKHNFVCRELLAGGRTIGMRIPDYKLFLRLFNGIDFPLAQTSANISGQASPLKATEIISQFKNRHLKPDLIVDAGYLGENQASTVIDLTKSEPGILRQGKTKLS